MNVIISPHPDDEIIGCYSLIKRKEINWVIYVNPDPQRLAQAHGLGEKLEFKVATLSYKDLYSYLEKAKEQGFTCIVPDGTDTHPLHKAINSVAKMSGCRLGYYSVDMAASFVKELSEESKQTKRDMLNKYYPDQKSLWENNWKYFLFEGIVFEI